jgi:hypothetical protein
LTKPPLALASAFLIAACGIAACGRPTATSTVAPSQLPPADAFQCVMKAFKDLGFQRTMYDEDDLRTSARKENPKITFSNTQFRKTWDRLDVEIAPGTAGTEVEILTVTEAEYFSQSGKILEQLPPSAEVQQAARDVQARCDGSTPFRSDSVPSAN